MKLPDQNIRDMSTDHSIPRDTVLIGIFGALWGLMEISLGVIIKGLRIPMGGAFLTAAACLIFLNGRFFIRRRGSILMMGMVAALLKIFSVGTVIAGPFMAILIEATIAEGLILLLGINRISFVLTASTLSLYTILHPFIAQGLIFGDNIYKIYLETFKQIALILNIDMTNLGLVLLIYTGFHLILGIMAGWLAFSLSIKVSQEIYHLNL